MGSILSNHDILGEIYNLCPNYYCAIVNKELYNIVLKNSNVCSNCHKMTKIFNHIEWITDDDEHCHSYYKNIEYYHIIKRMIQLDYTFFGKIKRQCYALNVYAINMNPLIIQYIKSPSKQLCWMALNKNVESIKYIDYPTNKMMLYAIKYGCFKFIKNTTEQICIEAIKLNPNNIMYCHQTQLLCNLAFQYDASTIIHIETIFKTSSMCLEAVQINGLLLEHMPNQTLEICWHAIENNYKSFIYVDEEYKTYDMCIYCIQKDPSMIKYIKNPIEEYYVEAFKQNYDYRQYISGGNVAIGYNSLINNIGNRNIGLGYMAGSKIINTDYNIHIGNEGIDRDDHVIRIGQQQLKNYQAGIYNVTLKEGCKAVYISPDGQLGTY